MNEFVCLWLPEIVSMDKYANDWQEYEKYLYSIFERDFIFNPPIFNGKILKLKSKDSDVNISNRKNFEHITEKSVENKESNKEHFDERLPDLRRCERIEWHKKIIENFPCKENCENCQKILYYEFIFDNRIRAALIFADVKFKVIIEYRNNYNIFITGYYIDRQKYLDAEIEKFNRYNMQKTPLE